MTDTKRSLRVLIVEDDDDDCLLLLRELRRAKYEVHHVRVQTADAMRAALRDQTFDVVLSDFSMPSFSALESLAVVKEVGIDLPFIIVSGTVEEDKAVEALRSGAHDFMSKGRLARLGPAIERELRDVEVRRRQREAEAAQRAVEERFRAIMEAATDGVVSTDQDGLIVYVNPAAERMFGYDESELLGQPITRLIPVGFRGAKAAVSSRRLPKTPQLVATEIVGLRKDGSEFPIDLSVGTWADGGVVCSAGIIRDISDRKKVEAQLLFADRMVSIGTLAAGVAHEINNPLAAVTANLEMAMRDLTEAHGTLEDELVESVQEGLRDAREAAERVRRIVKDLRVFSRGEHDKRGAVDVERVLESTLRMAMNEVRHSATLVKSYARVPPVEATDTRLGQVFLNLIVNAAQAIPAGRADQNEIRISTRTQGERVVVEIRDTGPGIPDEVMKRLFAPFVTTKPIGIGTGLGLSICHRIVTELGGEIAVETSAGKGTTFSIYLPIAEGEPIASDPTPPSSGEAARRGRVLVIDDDRLAANALKRFLASEHEVIAINRANVALDRIGAGERFDVILCDLMMPEVTGMDFHAELLKLAPEQAEAIIFLSGGAFTVRAREFLNEVPNQRMEKPFDTSHLRALINDRIR